MHIELIQMLNEAGGEPLTWQDVLHLVKVIDQRAPQPTALHAVDARDTATAADILEPILELSLPFRFVAADSFLNRPACNAAGNFIRLKVKVGGSLIKVSPWCERLRSQCIVDPLNSDPRETRQNGTRLGKRSDYIFNHVIGGGQADFDKPIDDLSPRDRVMLYALFNQKGHVLELIHAFQKLVDGPQQVHGATILDVGCGPFTAGLALANVAGNEFAFRYFGVDTSREMCALGLELANAARAAGGLNDQTQVRFSSSIADIDFGGPRLNWTFVVLSYLLASRSLNIELLVRQIVDACGRIGRGPVAVLYTNSAQAERRAAFPEFQSRMTDAGFKCNVVDTELLTDGDKPRNIHYALFTRAPLPMPLSEFNR